nr:immunoglobulin heavy chain junction region [Macaca mulatta]MOV51946.1 immunoglobulin heavy chain junction region [Macaca mulatta]
CARVQSNFDVW